jgi:hypothetical protein
MPAIEVQPPPRRHVAHVAVRVHLTPSAHACYAARHTVADALETWPDVEPGAAYDILLITTELVAAMVRNSAASGWLEIESFDDVVEVAVVEAIEALPRQRRGDHDDDERGLTIVAALSSDWGVEKLPRSRRVWAQVPLRTPAKTG